MAVLESTDPKARKFFSSWFQHLSRLKKLVLSLIHI